MNKEQNHALEKEVQAIRDFTKEYLQWIQQWQEDHPFNPADTSVYEIIFKQDNEEMVRCLQKKYQLSDETVSLFLG
ncbi:hypothetical protein M2448_003866 [Dysgonomonas sp. PF1-14]|uniref:hypothetical protein n=1 Tax=Dysgonomonas sp. PF1-14 TaxID=2940630 RepID=UPI0024747F93|nr:hypothetical protein [Dysgonomonas sp. PF1-14]MDH6309453.1 hypothetical protein [Dysgonomonas sp. PF1-14]MDH6310914.1 hypothetical protein [Dysgonomonas sp. PF1-14]